MFSMIEIEIELNSEKLARLNYEFNKNNFYTTLVISKLRFAGWMNEKSDGIYFMEYEPKRLEIYENNLNKLPQEKIKEITNVLENIGVLETLIKKGMII